MMDKDHQQQGGERSWVHGVPQLSECLSEPQTSRFSHGQSGDPDEL